ncbi:MAG: cupredoxin domain-containing protein [Vulcanimicrobiaceae bacterium]
MKGLLRRSALLAIAVLGLLVTAAPSSAHPSIDIVASNWKFTPATITLYAGETRELRLTSSSGVHGLESKALGLPLTVISPGKWVAVKVTPKKVGTYVLGCAILCGAGHKNMILTVKVVNPQ